jgi:hypothetical protein
MIKKAICFFIVICLSVWEGLFFAANVKTVNLSSETLEQSFELCRDTFFVCSFINIQIEKIMQGVSGHHKKAGNENRKSSNSQNDFKTIFLTSLNDNPLGRSIKIFQPPAIQASGPLLAKDLVIFYHCLLIILMLFLIERSKFCRFLARGSIVPGHFYCFLLFSPNNPYFPKE